MTDTPSKPGAELAKVMREVFLHNKSKKWGIKEVADAMGMKEDTFRSRFNAEERRIQITPEEIKAMIAAAPDLKLIDYFLEGTPYMAAERAPSPKDGQQNHDILRDRADIAIEEAADVIRQVRLAFQDNTICHNDKNRIMQEIKDLELAVATLKVTV